MRNLFSFRNHMYIYIFTAVEESTRLSFGALARVVSVVKVPSRPWQVAAR